MHAAHTTGMPSAAALFDNFKDTDTITQKEQILWPCIQDGLQQEGKSVNLAKHLIKEQHVTSIKMITSLKETESLLLGLPVEMEEQNLIFIRDFYLLFDVSKKNMGAIQKMKNSLLQNKIPRNISGIELLQILHFNKPKLT
jgi:hypothetical protein